VSESPNYIDATYRLLQIAHHAPPISHPTVICPSSAAYLTGLDSWQEAREPRNQAWLAGEDNIYWR